VTDESFAHGLLGVTLDGRYRLDAVLGEGGMGSVFRATQLAMDRKVAVKLLKPHLTNEPAALQRFAREARATLKVDSPHAVKILDFGVTPLGDYYMVLEYLDGRTVQRELEIDGPFAPARVAHIARHALHALGTAHGQGLIHRDVKPDNLLLMRVGSDPDHTKILDFGVAKLMQGAATSRSQLALTAAGMVFGTPEFMSPEQACGQELDGRSDLYSLAVTMFVMLTGTTLFEAKTAIAWLTHHARTPAPHLAMVRPELAAYPALDDLLQRCLAKHREARPETAAEMAAQIAALEPTLTSAPAASRQVEVRAERPPTAQSRESSYVHALADTGLASPVAAGPRAGVGSAPTVGFLPTTQPPRRKASRWIGGVVIASLLGVVIGLVIRRSTSPGTASSDAPAVAVAAGAADAGPTDPAITVAPSEAGPTDPAIAAAPSDAGPTDPAITAAPSDARATDVMIAAVPPVSPVSPVSPVPEDAPAAPVHVSARVRNAAAEEHLHNAEEAFRDGNRLRQLAEADLALRADPRSVRAKFLLGDAQLKNNDPDRGCATLHALKGIQMAQDRARAAGCPGD
jgi:eukaryotic-like serine/threonine-protein kinase